jgi:lysyl-tRNA synthetase class II
MRKITTLVVAATLLVAAMFVIPQTVRARDGQDDSSSSSGTSTGTSGSSGSSTTTESETEQHATQDANELMQKLRQQRLDAEKQRLDGLKQAEKNTERSEQRKEAFAKACQNRSNSFAKRMQDISSHAKKQAATLDTINDRLQAFVKDKNLTVPNYDTLLTAVQTQRKVVEDLSGTIVGNAGSFDCTSNDTAKESLATFKDSLQQAIDALKTYKNDLKALIKAVKTAAEASKPTETEGASNAQQ